MNKTFALSLVALLGATPILVLLLGIQNEAPTSIWQLSSQNLLEYARRQPGRLIDFATGKQRNTFEKVVEDTGTAVSALPGATVHVAGAALVAIKHASIEGLRSSLQGLEAAYLRSESTLASLAARFAVTKDKLRNLSYSDLKRSTSLVADKGAALFRDFWEWFGPGGHLHPEEFLERYHGHIVIECLLAIVIGYLFIQRSVKWSSRRSAKILTEEEIDDLCEEWQPEPLHNTLPPVQHPFEPPVVTSSVGAYVTMNGKRVLNLASYNFLGTNGDPKILEACKATVNKYGVGACGPRGFYGTIDVHLNLEERLAKFMGRGREEAIIYSYDLSTMPSVLPAFANARDLLVIDEMSNFGIQNGANLSRARVVTFKHNDPADLERVLQEEVHKHNVLKKPLNRRFIVVEGIYAALGDLAPLTAIVSLKHKYKFRLVVDESLSFGVLGATGRGACEHFGLQNDDVEIICASMGNALGSIGGFCAGDRMMVDHQRLSGLGYCFSAALPPYLATAALGSLDALEERGSQLLPQLRRNARLLHEGLGQLEGLALVADETLSPIAHVKLTGLDSTDRSSVLKQLESVAEEALSQHGVLFAVTRTSALDKVQLVPTLRLAVTAVHTEEEIAAAVKALHKATTVVLNGKR